MEGYFIDFTYPSTNYNMRALFSLEQGSRDCFTFQDEPSYLPTVGNEYIPLMQLVYTEHSIAKVSSGGCTGMVLSSTHVGWMHASEINDVPEQSNPSKPKRRTFVRIPDDQRLQHHPRVIS